MVCGPYDSSFFTFDGSLKIVFHNGYINMCLQQQQNWQDSFVFPPHLHEYLSSFFFFSFFFSNNYSNGCEACLTFVLMETSDVRHLFKYLLANSISFGKYLFVHFYLGYLFLLNQVMTLCFLGNILSNIWPGNNVFCPTTCLFSLLVIPFSEQTTFFLAFGFSQSYLFISTSVAFYFGTM